MTPQAQIDEIADSVLHHFPDAAASIVISVGEDGYRVGARGFLSADMMHAILVEIASQVVRHNYSSGTITLH